MHRITTGIALAAILPVTNALAVESDLETQVFTYLDSIHSLSGRYEQYNPDGTQTAGDFYLQRPSKIHFAEDPEDGIILIADGSWVAIIDTRTGEAPRYPLESTPFASLLSDLPSKDKNIRLLDLSNQDGTIRAVFTQQNEEVLGEVTLVLQKEPIELQGWLVKDEQKQVTAVRLHIKETNQPVAERLFHIHLFDKAP